MFDTIEVAALLFPMARGMSGVHALVLLLWWSCSTSCVRPPPHIRSGNNVEGVEQGRSLGSPASVTDNTATTNEAYTNSHGDVPLKEIRSGVFQLGDVRIDKQQRTVSFPAVMNLSQGPMEYLVVSSWGKVHESILRTETEPYRIHVAMLLLGARGMGTDENETLVEPQPFVSHPSSMRIPGDNVTLEIKWSSKGKVTQKKAHELIFNGKSKSVLRKGDWVYNGSLLEGHSFLAQREGSIVSLVTDPEALINNAGLGHDDDTIWTPNPRSLPPVNDLVEVVIKLTDSKLKEK